jgi:hypothetical protein
MMGAGKSVPEHMLTYDISSMFEMGTGKVLSQEVAGTAGNRYKFRCIRRNNFPTKHAIPKDEWSYCT